MKAALRRGVYLRSRADVRAHAEGTLDDLKDLKSNLGEAESDERTVQAVEVARVALRYLARDGQRDQIDQLDGMVRRLYATLLTGDSEKGPRPFYTIDELAHLCGLSRWAMKARLDRHGVPYAPPPGKTHNHVLLKDLVKWPEWAGVEMKRGWRRGSGLAQVEADSVGDKFSGQVRRAPRPDDEMNVAECAGLHPGLGGDEKKILNPNCEE